MSESSRVQRLLELLAGQEAPFKPPTRELVVSDRAELGYSQLNELLLLFGFDRITRAFFRFLIDGTTDYSPGDAFSSLEELDAGVQRFRETALLLYGNVKFAFKSLSRDAELLDAALHSLEPVADEQFEARHEPIQSLDPIPPEDAYLTGYLIERQLRERIKRDPKDAAAMELERKRLRVVERAKRNHEAYLASDHLDVYVATSMRERHEFASINRLTRAIFEHERIRSLKLRWFDPTQAYCGDRIDKGLSEALMLRRATCTIYLAQESDTLGKDSELASTLAQGKPVVAYVPTADSRFVDSLLEDLTAADEGEQLSPLMLKQLRIFDPAAAWSDEEVRGWLQDPNRVDLETLKSRLTDRISSHYDGRADLLKESHPLGIQVNLESGVANGVLVVRNVDDCAELVRRIVTQRLQLKLEEWPGYTALRETISGCIFRVMTRDAMLTNTFWNFYIDPAV